MTFSEDDADFAPKRQKPTRVSTFIQIPNNWDNYNTKARKALITGKTKNPLKTALT